MEVVMGRAAALAWSLWAEMGVSGWQHNHTSHAIDPERLILFTAFLGDADPRLRDESTDWCIAYGRYVSAARLRNLLTTQTPEVRATFAGMAATVNAHSNLRWPSATQARPYARTQRSAIADFTSPSLVVLRLRALFGVGARAEVLRAFLAAPSARFSAADVAPDAGYTKRNIAEAMDALRVAGLLRAETLRNQRRFGLDDAEWLTSLPGELPQAWPRWSSVFRVLEGLIAGAHRADRLTQRMRTVEASAILRDLRADLERVGVRLSQEESGRNAWATLQRLSDELPAAWASGSFSGAA
jgi:hypothetical protein